MHTLHSYAIFPSLPMLHAGNSGNQESQGLGLLCDNVYWFTEEWRGGVGELYILQVNVSVHNLTIKMLHLI